MVSLINKKRGVSFKESVRVRKTTHINDYSEDEIDACWSTRSEQTLSKQLIRKDVVRMECGMVSDDSCSRGLEGRTKTGSRLRKQRRLALVEAVLDEQELQFNEGQKDVQMISDLCSVVSRASVAEARLMGIMDEQAARAQDGMEVMASKTSTFTPSPAPRILKSILRHSFMNQFAGRAA